MSTGPAPCELLTRHAGLLPGHGHALDLACGLGGNALLLCRHGLQTTAVDDSTEVIEQARQYVAQTGLAIECIRADAVTVLQANRYAVITVSRFLDRSLAQAIERALCADGLLYYQTFTVAVPAGHGPKNRNYLLQRNELPGMFAGLSILVYQEAMQHDPYQAGLVACRVA